MSKKQKSGVIDKGENTMINYKPLTSNQINEAILFCKRGLISLSNQTKV